MEVGQVQQACLFPFNSDLEDSPGSQKWENQQVCLPTRNPKSEHLKDFPVHLGQTPSTLLWPPRSFGVWPLLAFPASSHVNIFFFSSQSSRAEMLNRIFHNDENILHLCYPIPEKAMATHSSSLAWTIPWTEEPGRLQSMGSLGVRHD